MESVSAEGFIVHAYKDARRNRIHVIGRLTDGRSFASAFPVPDPLVCIRKLDLSRAKDLFERLRLRASYSDSAFLSFDGNPCVRISCSATRDADRAIRALRQEHIPVYGSDQKEAASFLIRNGIRGGVRLSGDWRAGKSVQVVFNEPLIEAAHGIRAPLSVLSLDIETEEPAGTIRAVGLSRMRMGIPSERTKRLIFNGAWPDGGEIDGEISVCVDERSLLESLVLIIREFDPDIITGWNVIDFDFPRLAAAFSRNGLEFTLGRSMEGGRFFPAENGSGEDGVYAKRSASVFLPGRQVLDGLRLIRTGWESFDSYTLDAVATQVLGKGKTVKLADAEKLAELDRLYAEEPLSFCRYCLNDADLVLDILEKRNVLSHTIERSALTGAGIDKAWTSVASFERVYAEGLFARGILEPELDASRSVSGAAGGTVLDPLAGLFCNVAVFDFRSLYPSVMRTFNIDPLSHELASHAGGGETNADLIRAPNGAAFVRESGILPQLIGEYFRERLAAIDRGDDDAAFVYKILMNSFYGVLGTPKCRYARTELAGAITSFGKLCLLFARDFFRERGYRVLYGDTDSVFVEMAKDAGAETGTVCEGLAAALNAALRDHVREAYGLESFINIRFEKLYRKFFIPRIRSDEQDAEHGRAKGYAGLLIVGDGRAEVEIKGMEAARSDYTPLAQRFQRELLDRLFREDGTASAELFIREQTTSLYRGLLDGELVFRKKLRREPESYTASTPPHIKVARSLGWTHRRGTVEYLMTVNGPEALSLLRSPIDYAWYAASQLLPIARSAGLVAGFDAEAIIRSLHSDGQLEFSWECAKEKGAEDLSPPRP